MDLGMQGSTHHSEDLKCPEYNTPLSTTRHACPARIRFARRFAPERASGNRDMAFASGHPVCHCRPRGGFRKPLLAPQLTPALVFVLGITLIGAELGLIPGLITSIVAAAIFNFFLADPVFGFRMSTIGDLTPPIIFIACAVVSGLLSGRLKEKTSQLGRTNLQLESLLETSRTLQAAPDVDAIVTALGASVPGRLGFKLSLYGMKGGKPDALATADQSPDALDSAAKAIAGERVVRTARTITFRLEGSRSSVGALVIENTGGAHVEEAFLEGLASLVGLAFERAQFASVIAEAEANVRTEELKSALLSSVSHDLRTPITAISASASSLIEYGGHIDSETSQSLLQGIVEECDRLNRFTANLLELSRLQAGGPGIAGQVLSVHDVVRSVVQRLRGPFPRTRDQPFCEAVGNSGSGRHRPVRACTHQRHPECPDLQRARDSRDRGERLRSRRLHHPSDGSGPRHSCK